MPENGPGGAPNRETASKAGFRSSHELGHLATGFREFEFGYTDLIRLERERGIAGLSRCSWFDVHMMGLSEGVL